MNDSDSIKQQISEAQEKIGELNKQLELETDGRLKEAIYDKVKDEVATTKYLSVQLGEAEERDRDFSRKQTTLERSRAAQEQLESEEAETRRQAMFDSLAENSRQKFETIRKAEESQWEESKSARAVANSNDWPAAPVIDYDSDDIILPSEKMQPRGKASPVRVQHVTVRVSDVQRELPIVAKPLKFAIQSALFQIDQYRKEVSQNNLLCAELPEVLEPLLQMLDQLKEILTLIDYAIPENVESVSAVDAEKVAGYMERVKNQFAVEMETYFSPESLVKGITPTGIVLAFGTVGSFFGGPLGFAAGGVIGNIFAKNSKPDAAHNAVGEIFSTQDTDSDIDNL